MSQQIEIEFKTLLSKEDYKRICDYYQLQQSDFFSQTNYYFDTNDQTLAKNNCGLRIRALNGAGELTLKTPTNEGRLETTDRLTALQVEKRQIRPDGAVAKKLREYQVLPTELKLLAELTTKRAEFKIAEGLLALDENWYSNQHDYELELEVDQTTDKNTFLQLLENFHIPYQTAENKVKRALKNTAGN